MWDILRKKKVFFTDDDDFENENDSDKNYYLLALSDSDKFNSEIESIFDDDKPQIEIVETLIVDEDNLHEEVDLIEMEEELHKPSEDCEGLAKLDDIESNDFFKAFTNGVNYILEGKEEWFYCVETESDGVICFSEHFVEEMLDKYSEHDEHRDIDPPDEDNFMSNIAPGSQEQEPEWDMCM